MSSVASIDTLVFDVGSTFTKVVAFGWEAGRLFWLGRAQAPTTVENIDTGLSQAFEALKRTLGVDALDCKHVLSTSSAAGGLRMVAMGFMPRVTAKAAKEVAMNAGARVLEVISFEDPLDYKREMLREIRPDIILLAGGTDGGDKDAMLNDARVIAESGLRTTVVIAGNSNGQKEAQQILQRDGLETVCVPNVMPNIHHLNVRPAREVIHERFIHQITEAKGMGRLMARLTVNKVIPTPGAVLMAAELLANGTHEEDGCSSLVFLDLGGATTDVHSVLPHLDKLSVEERGLVLTNEKQAAYRTVEGNLGVRVSARGILEASGAKSVLLRGDCPQTDENEQALDSYASYLEAHPSHLAADDQQRAFDRGLAVTALEVALKRHAGYVAQQFDPVMGTAPGTPVGRDLREVKTVFAIGGIFAHLGEAQARELVVEALRRPGISLLPVSPRIIIDKDYLLYSLGVLAQLRPTAALRFAKTHFALLDEGNGRRDT